MMDKYYYELIQYGYEHHTTTLLTHEKEYTVDEFNWFIMKALDLVVLNCVGLEKEANIKGEKDIIDYSRSNLYSSFEYVNYYIADYMNSFGFEIFEPPITAKFKYNSDSSKFNGCEKIDSTITDKLKEIDSKIDTYYEENPNG